MNGKGRHKNNELTGNCICPQCGYSTSHKRGIPCFTLICSKCNIPLMREDRIKNKSEEKNNQNKFPVINSELCIKCGACINECLANAISFENDKAKIDYKKCINCRACINACPVEAIN